VGDLSHRYLWGEVVDQLFADEQLQVYEADDRVLWALTDHLGTPRAWIDSAGTTINHAAWAAFGKRMDVDPIGATLEWTGHFRDSVTGLQLNGQRWYNPNIGRWMSEDPIGFAAGDANLHRYVGNAPTMYLDPSGLIPGEAAWTAKAGAKLGVKGALRFVPGVGVVVLASDIPAAYEAGQKLEKTYGIGESIGDLLFPPQPRLRSKLAIPRVDRTGKVHGEIPTNIPRTWTRKDIQDAIDELDESINTRLEEEERKGVDEGHRDRINEEIDFRNKLRDQLRAK
jgi:RHS repeat-associated protein